MRAACAIVIATALVTIVACTRGVNDPDVPPAWAAFVDEYCQLLTPCCDKPSDGARCRLHLASLRPATLAVTAGARGCLAALRAATQHGSTCTEGPHLCDLPELQSAATTTNGTKQPGETCSDMMAADCAQSPDVASRCAFSNEGSGDTGRCERLTLYGRAGDGPCIGTTDRWASQSGLPIDPARSYLCDLREGLRCAGNPPTCQPIVELGGHCTRSYPSTQLTQECGLHARCDLMTRTCISASPRGGACGDGCDDGASCGNGNVCVADRASYGTFTSFSNLACDR